LHLQKHEQSLFEPGLLEQFVVQHEPTAAKHLSKSKKWSAKQLFCAIIDMGPI